MEEDYYYAYGPYVNPRIEARYKSYRFFAEYKYAHYDSFEGRDRRKPSNDFHLADKHEEYSFVMGRLIDFFDVPFLKTHPLWIEAEVRRIERSKSGHMRFVHSRCYPGCFLGGYVLDRYRDLRGIIEM